MLPPIAISAINRLLRQNSWALVRLQPFTKKIVHADCFPLSLHLAITEDGTVSTADATAAPDVSLRLTPGLLLRLAARDATVWSEINVEGEPQLAAALHHVARNIRWDVEEDLSRVFGDIVAHRMVKSGRTVDTWARQGADNLARSFAEYWTEEQPLIASRADVAQFNRDIDTLRDDVARLEKRIERFAATRQR